MHCRVLRLNTLFSLPSPTTSLPFILIIQRHSNIFKEFVEMNFAAIVVFAIAMGVATSKVVSRMVNKSQLNGGNPDLAFVDLLVELDRILGVMIIWVIMCTPVRIIVSIARTKL